MFTRICLLVITSAAALTRSAFIIDSDSYTAPTSHLLWRAPEADFPPSYFWLRRPPTIAQKTNSATRRAGNGVASCHAGLLAKDFRSSARAKADSYFLLHTSSFFLSCAYTSA